MELLESYFEYHLLGERLSSLKDISYLVGRRQVDWGFITLILNI